MSNLYEWFFGPQPLHPSVVVEKLKGISYECTKNCQLFKPQHPGEQKSRSVCFDDCPGVSEHYTHIKLCFEDPTIKQDDEKASAKTIVILRGTGQLLDAGCQMTYYLGEFDFTLEHYQSSTQLLLHMTNLVEMDPCGFYHKKGEPWQPAPQERIVPIYLYEGSWAFAYTEQDHRPTTRKLKLVFPSAHAFPKGRMTAGEITHAFPGAKGVISEDIMVADYLGRERRLLKEWYAG